MITIVDEESTLHQQVASVRVGFGSALGWCFLELVRKWSLPHSVQPGPLSINHPTPAPLCPSLRCTIGPFVYQPPNPRPLVSFPPLHNRALCLSTTQPPPPCVLPSAARPFRRGAEPLSADLWHRAGRAGGGLHARVLHEAPAGVRLAHRAVVHHRQLHVAGGQQLAPRPSSAATPTFPPLPSALSC